MLNIVLSVTSPVVSPGLSSVSFLFIKHPREESAADIWYKELFQFLRKSGSYLFVSSVGLRSEDALCVLLENQN